jgi:hypothetical protein
MYFSNSVSKAVGVDTDDDLNDDDELPLTEFGDDEYGHGFPVIFSTQSKIPSPQHLLHTYLQSSYPIPPHLLQSTNSPSLFSNNSINFCASS